MNIELMEQYIQKVKSIVACRIIVDNNKEIQEIHILSGTSRNPKQILRDIEAVLLTQFDISIDHKKISIAQIQDEITGKDESRLKLDSVEYHNQGSKGTIKVILHKNEDVYEFSQSGINTVNNLKRLVGSCILNVVEQYCGIDDLFNLEEVKVINISDCEAVVVLVSSLIKGCEYKLSGTALVKHDLYEAIARATLSAINRYTNQVYA